MYDVKEIEGIKAYMLSNEQTLAIAESVTSGHLQAAISLAGEASNFFQGGITAYNLGQKARHLQINPIHANSCNSVSQIIADEMALNAITLFSSDWAIAVTGFASKVPDMGIDELFAYYAIAFKKEIVDRGTVKCDDTEPLKVQLSFTNQLLKILNRQVKDMSAT